LFNYFILHKSFGKNDNFITCYIGIGVFVIIEHFANRKGMLLLLTISTRFRVLKVG